MHQVKVKVTSTYSSCDDYKSSSETFIHSFADESQARSYVLAMKELAHWNNNVIFITIDGKEV